MDSQRVSQTLLHRLAIESTDSHEYYRSTWIGIAGDRRWNIGSGHHFDMVDNPWLEQHVIKNHGPLGALYPPLKFIMEGDTPSFLGLIDNGLHWETSPDARRGGAAYRRREAPAPELAAEKDPAGVDDQARAGVPEA